MREQMQQQINNKEFKLSEKEAKIIVQELQNGTRAWFLKGKFFVNEGYTICPIKKDEINLPLSKNNISRFITGKEALKLIGSDYCKNKKYYKIVFDILNGKK
jgi:hypothetical protein